jgi:hypothetical protein
MPLPNSLLWDDLSSIALPGLSRTFHTFVSTAGILSADGPFDPTVDTTQLQGSPATTAIQRAQPNVAGIVAMANNSGIYQLVSDLAATGNGKNSDNAPLFALTSTLADLVTALNAHFSGL